MVNINHTGGMLTLLLRLRFALKCLPDSLASHFFLYQVDYLLLALRAYGFIYVT